jgi:hypothetical protein
MPAPGSGPWPARGQAPAGIQQARAAARRKCRLDPSLRWGDGDCGGSVWSNRASITLHRSHGQSAARTFARDGMRGEGAPASALQYKSRLTGAPTRRLRSPVHTFAAPHGTLRSFCRRGGWRRPPGRSSPCPARRLGLASPDRRGRRSLPTRPRRSRQRPLGGRDERNVNHLCLDVKDYFRDCVARMKRQRNPGCRLAHECVDPGLRAVGAPSGLRADKKGRRVGYHHVARVRTVGFAFGSTHPTAMDLTPCRESGPVWPRVRSA